MGSNMQRLILFSLRLLQCSSSLIIIIIEILGHTGVISLIESNKVHSNDYELFFEYCVMNLGFVLSVLYLFRFNQRWKQGSYKYEIFIDCVLMNAWMIYGILRLSPEFNDNNILTCNQYKPKQREGCVLYISTLVLGYVISGSYFLTAILSTWLWSEQKNPQNSQNSQINSNSNSDSNSNSNRNSNLNSNSNVNNSDPSNISNFNFFINSLPNSNPINTNSSSDPTKSKNSNDLPQIVTINHEDVEFNRSEGTIVIFRKPSPSFLKYEQSSNRSSVYENNSCISEYSLGSSFSRTYGSIIIPRKYSDDSNVISTYSENSTSSKRISSTFSDKTSRSSNYDGSIIIKLVT